MSIVSETGGRGGGGGGGECVLLNEGTGYEEGIKIVRSEL